MYLPLKRKRLFNVQTWSMWMYWDFRIFSI